MNKIGPIVIIDDDRDDQIQILEALRRLRCKNEIVILNDGEAALQYLESAPSEPFVIISDINMPRVNGLELKKQIDNDENFRSKSIPFIFFTTSVSNETVQLAYNYRVQGLFQKPWSITEIENILKQIIDYWTNSF